MRLIRLVCAGWFAAVYLFAAERRVPGFEQYPVIAENYPGVTVEEKVGRFVHRGRPIDLVDLPGTYSLNARSPDEAVVRDVPGTSSAYAERVIGGYFLDITPEMRRDLLNNPQPLYSMRTMTPEAGKAFIDGQVDIWSQVVRDNNIKAD